jgi:peptide/nickel transport system permease protein
MSTRPDLSTGDPVDPTASAAPGAVVASSDTNPAVLETTLGAEHPNLAEPQGRVPGPVLPKGATKRRKPRSIAFWLASAWVGLVVFVAVFADVLPLARYDIIVDLEPRLGPRLSFTEPLGTDGIGRSVTSRLIFGARQSLIIGLATVVLSLAIGLVLGIVAGYFRGKIDAAFNVLMDAFLSIPALVLLLAVASVGKRDISTVILGLVIIGIPTFARLARANTLALADREFVQAARAMGASNGRIISREIFPNVLLPISSYAFLWLAVVIVAEGSLSFLGVGIPPPKPSWGGMVNDGRPFLQTEPYLVFVPAICLVFTVLSFTIIGDRARRRFDTRESALS